MLRGLGRAAAGGTSGLAGRRSARPGRLRRLLTLAPADAAGRAFAAYGGVYIVASLIWAVVVEGARLSAWDLAGATLCLAGAAVILLGAR